MNQLERTFPWSIVALAAVVLLWFSIPGDEPADQFHYSEFGSLPVVERGRTKPWDTVARINLMIVTGSRETWTDAKGDYQPAIRWLLDTVSGRFAYEKTLGEGLGERGLTIRDDDVVGLLQLPPSDDHQYSLSDVLRQREELAKVARQVEQYAAKERTPLQAKLLKLHRQVNAAWQELNTRAYCQAPAAQHKVFRIENEEVLALLALKPRPRFRYALTEFADRLQDFYDVAEGAKAKERKEQTLYEAKVVELAQKLELYGQLVAGASPLAVPPPQPTQEWRSFNMVRQFHSEDSYSKGYDTMLKAYSAGDVAAFNRAVVAYRDRFYQQFPDLRGATALEVFFNYANPFFLCQCLYVVVFALGCLSWLGWAGPFRRAGLYLAVLTVSVHTLALLTRMYIQGRPPVTNLYSSAIFIGWGAVMTSIALDAIYRNGIGVVTAGAIGCCTLLIASALSLTGDTLEMMQAVLDTNFWLSTHVVAVTMGYTATFLAGVIATVYILLGLTTKFMDAEVTKVMGKMIYGVVCFAMLLSFVGTVLGGIWADQSWGRFWGWDPKENGALLIVIWNALILHARWGGLVKMRGMAMLAVFGIVVTAWSWFGTNLLGVGLHSYGFQQGAMTAMIWVDIAFLMVIGLACIPLRFWNSYWRPI